MALSHSPKIVTDGLVLCLDAADPKSYSGSGTTWYDRSGNGYDATLQGTIDFTSNHGGELNYGNNQIVDWVQLDGNAFSSITTSHVWSLETVMRLDTITGTRYMHSMSKGGDSNFAIVQVNSSGTIHPYNETKNSGSDAGFNTGEKFLFTIVHKSGSQDVYKNGVWVANYSAANDVSGGLNGWVLNQEQDGNLGGFSAVQNTPMGIYSVRLYNKSLTAEEVLQNYNAQKGRFS